MPASKAKRNMAPFVVSASDLAFIMLFFFMIVGNGATEVEKIEMPYKVSSQSGETSLAPIRIEIHDQNSASDSSRMLMIYTRAMPPETSFVSISSKILADPAGSGLVHQQIADFIDRTGVNSDSVSIDVFSAAHSYYGLVALAMASCYRLEYPCNLVYRADADIN